MQLLILTVLVAVASATYPSYYSGYGGYTSGLHSYGLGSSYLLGGAATTYHAPASYSYAAAPAVSYVAAKPAVAVAAAPAVSYVAAKPAITYAAAPAVSYVAKPAVTYAAAPAVSYVSKPAVQYVAPAPAVVHKPVTYAVAAPRAAVVSHAPAAVHYAAPAAAVSYAAPAAAVSYAAPAAAVSYAAPVATAARPYLYSGLGPARIHFVMGSAAVHKNTGSKINHKVHPSPKDIQQQNEETHFEIPTAKGAGSSQVHDKNIQGFVPITEDKSAFGSRKDITFGTSQVHDDRSKSNKWATSSTKPSQIHQRESHIDSSSFKTVPQQPVKYHRSAIPATSDVTAAHVYSFEEPSHSLESPKDHDSNKPMRAERYINPESSFHPSGPYVAIPDQDFDDFGSSVAEENRRGSATGDTAEFRADVSKFPDTRLGAPHHQSSSFKKSSLAVPVLHGFEVVSDEVYGHPADDKAFYFDKQQPVVNRKSA